MRTTALIVLVVICALAGCDSNEDSNDAGGVPGTDGGTSSALERPSTLARPSFRDKIER